jgi:pimeloyl-ACP methyl ester carboxylesterase
MEKRVMYDEKELIKESPLKSFSKIIKLDGCETFIVEMGKGENIIFANGIAAPVYTWRKVMTVLSKNFHVYGLDYKGTGFSGKPKEEYSIDVFSKQILDLMNFFNMKSAVLIGNSLGGEVSLNFAIKYPEKVKSLILIDTAGYQNNKEFTKLLTRLSRCRFVGNILKRHTSKRFARKIIEWALYNDKIIDKEMVNAYYKPMKTKGAFDAFIELVKNLSYTEFDYSKVRNIIAPTLIIWGEEDKWIPVSDAYKFHKDIKNSKLIVLKDCGHAPQEEKAEEVSKLIREFINENKK